MYWNRWKEFEDELARILTNYEKGIATGEDLYNFLVKLQNELEYLIGFLSQS